MRYFDFIWTDEAREHVARNYITEAEFEHVVRTGVAGFSKTSARRVTEGYTNTGRHLRTVYEQPDPATIIPVTAYDLGKS